MNLLNGHQQAIKYLENGDYSSAINYMENAYEQMWQKYIDGKN